MRHTLGKIETKLYKMGSLSEYLGHYARNAKKWKNVAKFFNNKNISKINIKNIPKIP